MNRKFICAILFVAFGCFNNFGQTPRKTPAPRPVQKPAVVISDDTQTPSNQQSAPPAIAAAPAPPVTVEMILNEAEKQTLNYQNAFKNLLANETKTFEQFDKNGQPKKQTVVESVFLVYQSPKTDNVVTELRNVTKVDGKPLPDSQARSQKLLAELQKTSSVDKELEKIQNENSRYDKTLEISGLTLFEARVLSEELRPYFEYNLRGTENLQGSDFYVVEYRQTKKSPLITVNDKTSASEDSSFDFKFDLPGALKNTDAFLSGKIWIDAKTFQVRREERRLTLQTPMPLVVLETTFNYQPSEFEILVPKQITLLSYAVRKNSEGNDFVAVKDTNVQFDYSKFRRFESDVKILDDN